MFRRAREPGWVAFRLHPERVEFARVADDAGRPQIHALEAYRKEEGGDANALERLRRELKLASHRGMLVLAPGEYQILQTEAPAVPPEELTEAVRWRVKDLLDFPVQSATLDLLDIPLDGSGTGRPKQIFAVAARNDLIGPRMQLFQDARIALEVIDIPEMAQRNVALLFEEESRGLALLAFDDSGGLLTFTCRGELYASRRIDISAQQLGEAQQERRAAFLERIGLELQRSFDHFDRQFSAIPIARLLVTAVAGVPELAPALASTLYVPVEELDLARVIDFPAVPELKDLARQGQYLHLVGAALRPAGGAA